MFVTADTRVVWDLWRWTTAEAGEPIMLGAWQLVGWKEAP